VTVNERRPGARLLPGGGTRFTVWAPHAQRVDLHLEAPDAVVALEAAGDGWFAGEADAGPGRRYTYALDGGERLPDPASGWQPDGVQGSSAVVGDDHVWTDGDWRGLPLEELVLYELHVGTFTPEGTFDAAITRLPALAEMGVTAIELMPVAEFPGSRNWGYDGVFPYAAQSTYGGPQGLKRLVDAAHREGIAVCLDVVYNHLGPEGNVVQRYGPYFSIRHRTPWGEAVNVDGPGSDAVRGYFVGNALRWLEEFHLDALRLDAVQEIIDTSAVHFLAELADAVADLRDRIGRPLHLIAESDLNDPRTVTARAAGGLGMDAQWNDDFHHSLHRQLTGEGGGYYADFGDPGTLARAYRDGFVLDGGRSAYRRRRHGASARGVPGRRFVVYSQNHDQVGNRMLGDRLIETAGEDAARFAAVAVLLAPFVPLLFMGEEYGERAPFQYFVSHTDPQLVEAVRRGRAAEFAHFQLAGQPPDPQGEETFRRSTLRWAARDQEPGRAMLALYQELLRLRRERPGLRRLDPGAVETSRGTKVTWIRRAGDEGDTLLCLYTGAGAAELDVPFAGPWEILLDSRAERFGGAGGAVLDGRLIVNGRSAVVLGMRSTDA
jgi:maltooligosyltrehalose trehalohydrolase